MAKKYLNLEEAAAQLGMDKDELNRLREDGDIRGFADRGAWKFRMEDIEELGRSFQADSDPAIPLISGDNDDDLFGSAILEENDISDGSDSVIDEDEVGEQATVIRGSVHDEDDSPMELSSSDSDVRLVIDDGDDLLLDSEPELVAFDDDSDSDVRLADDSNIDLSSDSDVKLVDADSEPDLETLEIDTGSDSDVKLVADDSGISGSESDVALVGDDDFDLGSDSDVALISDDSNDSSILSEDSGISLASDSGISLAGPLDSGISLEVADESGISLVDEDESGISLVDDDSSGISLEGDSDSDISITADSGISLEPFNVDDVDKTVPMMTPDGDKNATLEIPSLDDDDDSSFDLSDSSADTSVLMLNEDGNMDGSSGSVILDSDDDSTSGIFDDEDDLDDEFSSDDSIAGDFDDDDDFDDIYDADDDDFDDSFQSGESHAEFVAPSGFGGRSAAMAPAEAEWGTGTFVALSFSTILLGLCGVMMYDLVRTMWHYDDPSSFSSALLDTFRGMF